LTKVSNLILFYNKYLLTFYLDLIYKDFSQISIIDSFNKSTSNKDENFTIVPFKRLLLDFIVNNNISFRAVTTLSFKKLLTYLN
jgi:hypothetical protein